jgi:hypothetical protein
MALANDAAEVYSFVGLDTKAKLLERLKRFDEAEQYFSTAATRYSNVHDLAAFYLRRAAATGQQQYRDLAEPLVKKVFKDGMSPVPADVLNAPPQFGVRVVQAAARGAVAGVRDGDIIVSVDGIQVQTYPQYQIAIQVAEAPDLSLVLWRDGRFLEIRSMLRHTWGSASLVSYDWRQPILR